MNWRAVWLGLALVLTSFYLSAAHSAAPLVLDGASHQEFDNYLAVLADPAGTLDFVTVRQADAAGHFVRQKSGGLNFGYRPGATWVRFAIANPTNLPQQRWLVLDNPFLASCVLHLIDGSGAAIKWVNGATVPVEQRPVATRKINFPLVLAPGEVQTAYLRLGGPSLQMSAMSLWQPAAYAEEHGLRLSFKTLVIVVTVMVVVFFSVLAWRGNGQLAMLAVGVGDACMGAVIFMLEGVGTGWLPANNDELWQHRLFGVFLLSSLFFHIIFARAFLDMPKAAPSLAKAMSWLAALCVLAIGMQGIVANPGLFSLSATLVLTTVKGLLVVAAAWRGIRNARQYLMVWGVLLLVVIVRIAGAIFEAPLFVQGDDLPLLGFLVATLILGYVIYRDIRLVRKETDSAHQSLLAFQRDEQVRLAAAVESRTSELHEAKLMAETAGQARLAFLSTVSHELRTPLHTIVGYAQLLRKGGRREADTKLSVIETSGLQLLYLIDQILEYIRGDNHAAVMRTETVSLGQLARQLEDAGALLAAAGGNRFAVELDDDLPVIVEADDHRLTQVLTNLIGNACKYTSNGTVTLRIEREPISKETENVPPESGGSHLLRFTVEDTGLGIAPEHQARIFEPFSRAPGSEHRPGVGLGLTIARQIVRAMGGEIGLDSEVGRGSRFFFTLPLREVSEDAFFPTSSEPPRIVGQVGPQRGLLVVDDITENRLFLHDLCTDWGFRVLTANDGAEALEICRNPEVELAGVLVDQFMPVMDGWGFLREVRTIPERAGLPVILISAAEPERPENFPVDVYFDKMLLKPIRHQELAEYLRQRLDLEWILEQPGSGSAEVAPSVAHEGQRIPSAGQLAEFSGMLALGRVVAIRRWAEDLLLTEPELSDFAAEVAELVEGVDLVGLKRLLARVEAELARPPN